jgi:hypothetical protein
MPQRQSYNNNYNGPPQPWQSGKSIDDLESIMAQRWGTGSSSGSGSSSVGNTNKLPLGNTKPKQSSRPMASDTKAMRQWEVQNQKSKQTEKDDDDDEWVLVDDDDDEEDFVMGRKAVLDPWQKEDLQKANVAQKKPPLSQRPLNDNRARPPSRRGGAGADRDFYDQDDEGYEYKERNNRGDSLSSGSKPNRSSTSTGSGGRINVAHMIAPKPAGGRGTFYDNDRDARDTVDRFSTSSGSASANGGGYFFNSKASRDDDDDKDMKNSKPIPRTASPTRTAAGGAAASPLKSKRDAEPQVANIDALKPPKRERVMPPKPLFDEKNKPLLLTVQQAMRTFEQRAATRRELQNGEEDDDNDDNDSWDAEATFNNPTCSWSDLGITSPLLRENLNTMSCSTPLDVQDKACPPILTGQDVLVGTYTGSGKTLAFLTPLIQRLLWNIEGVEEDEDKENLIENDSEDDEDDDDNDDKDDMGEVGFNKVTKAKKKGGASSAGLSILIVAPGRELASQIASVARELVQDTTLTVQLAIGGTTFTRNWDQIRKSKPNILVGTPGRIAELVVGKPGEKCVSIVPRQKTCFVGCF